MPDRIRWHDWHETSILAFSGYVGGVGEIMFRIFRPGMESAGEWILTSDLPAMTRKRSYDASPDALKRLAEQWLLASVSSLGAVFPEETP